MRTLFQIVLGLVSLLFLIQCAGKEVSKDDPEALYSDAEESFQDERYLIAVEKFRDLKNRFPYHSRATDAELRIADSYFAQENYIEAESAYEIFKELHPTHPRSDYVQFQIGMSYYNQVPSNSTRDMSAAYKTIEAFTTLFERYPKSSHVPKGKESLLDVQRRLAEFENYVADFYFRRKHYLSASYRYATLLKEFPNLGFDEEATYRLGISYFQVRMFESARETLKRFILQFPKSSLVSDSQALLEEISRLNLSKSGSGG